MKFNKTWWKADKQKIHEDVFPYVKQLKTKQSSRGADLLQYLRLYGAQGILGFKPNQYARSDSKANNKHRIALNVAQAMCDTATAKITKNKPRPKFLTSEGDWSNKTKSKKLNKFCVGQFHQNKVYEVGTQVFKDATVFGDGFMKIYRTQDNKIKVERIFPYELHVDDMEALYGQPRQLHQEKYIHREVLMEAYPKFKDAIKKAGEDTDAGDMWNLDTTEPDAMVKVMESWHLASGPKAKDGRHTITISTATLFEEEYTRDYFPFVKMQWNSKLLGYWGRGLCEQIKDLQLEINKLLRTIQLCMHLTSVPKVFVHQASQVVAGHLNNQIGGIVKYTGTKPSYESVGTVPPELFSQVDRLYQRAFEITGISQLSAQSKKPGGLDSGAALREYNEIETERFMNVAQNYERFYIEVARQMVDLAKEISEVDKDYSVDLPGKEFLESIKWSDIDLAEDKYTIQCHPVSSLPQSPAGRLKTVQELLQAGFLTQEEGLQLLDFPDIEGILERKNAPIDNIERMIDRMMDEGIYEPPEPYQNLELGIRLCKESYLKFTNEGAPEDRLELLRNWITDADAAIQRATAEMAAQQQPQQPPQANPEAPPVSDLLQTS